MVLSSVLLFYVSYSFNYLLTLYLISILLANNYFIKSSNMEKSFIMLLVLFNLGGLPLSPSFFFKNAIVFQSLALNSVSLFFFFFLNTVYLLFYQQVLLYFIEFDSYYNATRSFSGREVFLSYKNDMYLIFLFYFILFIPYNMHIIAMFTSL